MLAKAAEIPLIFIAIFAIINYFDNCSYFISLESIENRVQI